MKFERMKPWEITIRMTQSFWMPNFSGSPPALEEQHSLLFGFKVTVLEQLLSTFNARFRNGYQSSGDDRLLIPPIRHCRADQRAERDFAIRSQLPPWPPWFSWHSASCAAAKLRRTDCALSLPTQHTLLSPRHDSSNSGKFASKVYRNEMPCIFPQVYI